MPVHYFQNKHADENQVGVLMLLLFTGAARINTKRKFLSDMEGHLFYRIVTMI